MTTIAARQKLGRWVIAADSQETREGTDAGGIKLPCQKLFTHVKDGKVVIVATCGDSAEGRKLVEHIRAGTPFTGNQDRPFECLVLDKSGNLWLYDEDMMPQMIVMEFYAIGTGHMAAFAAMEQGADPRRAVEIAAKYDPYTGGDIVVVD